MPRRTRPRPHALVIGTTETIEMGTIGRNRLVSPTTTTVTDKTIIQGIVVYPLGQLKQNPIMATMGMMTGTYQSMQITTKRILT